MEKSVNRGKYFKVFNEIKEKIELNDKLLESLQIHPYFKDEMENVVMHSATDGEKLQFILVEFTRSRSTCDELIRLLRESGNTEVADQLVEYNTSEAHNLKRLDVSSPEYANPEIPFNVTKAPKEGSLYYKMDRKPRGKCIIINNVKNEVFMESKRFRYDFEKLHFQVDECYDLNATQMSNKLKTMAAEADPLSQALVVMIITHGLEERVLGSDACEALRVLATNPDDTDAQRVVDTDVMDIVDIADIFSDKNCPNLRNAPKLIFTTCCRNYGDSAVESNNLAKHIKPETITYEDNTKFPVMRSMNKQWVDNNRDTYICYSCAEGRKTFIDEKYGITYFGQALSISIAKYACDEPLSAIMSRTCDLMQFFTNSSDVNLPEFRGKGLRRQLYFNP